MRTAEEIYNEFIGENVLPALSKIYIVNAINSARKEAIEEYAESVKLCGQLYCDDEEFYGQDEINMTNKRGYIDTWIKPDKQSILKLIDELK